LLLRKSDGGISKSRQSQSQLSTVPVLSNSRTANKFLATDEKEWIREELQREEQQKLEHCRYSVLQALASGRVWHLVLIYFGMMIGSYALISWAPQLVKSLSSLYSNSMVGFFLPIPHPVGLAGMIFISHSSGRTAERRYHVAIPALAGGAALVLIPSKH